MPSSLLLRLASTVYEASGGTHGKQTYIKEIAAIQDEKERSARIKQLRKDISPTHATTLYMVDILGKIDDVEHQNTAPAQAIIDIQNQVREFEKNNNSGWSTYFSGYSVSFWQLNTLLIQFVIEELQRIQDSRANAKELQETKTSVSTLRVLLTDAKMDQAEMKVKLDETIAQLTRQAAAQTTALTDLKTSLQQETAALKRYQDFCEEDKQELTRYFALDKNFEDIRKKLNASITAHCNHGSVVNSILTDIDNLYDKYRYIRQLDAKHASSLGAGNRFFSNTASDTLTIRKAIIDYRNRALRHLGAAPTEPLNYASSSTKCQPSRPRLEKLPNALMKTQTEEDITNNLLKEVAATVVNDSNQSDHTDADELRPKTPTSRSTTSSSKMQETDREVKLFFKEVARRELAKKEESEKLKRLARLYSHLTFEEIKELKGNVPGVLAVMKMEESKTNVMRALA
jgi:hypothetical protein